MATPKDELVFEYDWLSLDKADIELICYLLLNDNAFVGSLSELCRALGRSDNTRSRNGRRQVIERLHSLGILSYNERSSRTFEIILSAPKGENQVTIERRRLESIMRREYERSVAWQQVLKVYLWLSSRGKGVIEFQRSELSSALGVSTSTITEAVSVLNDHFGAISAANRGYIDENGNPRCSGKMAQLSAFWMVD